ncbi:MAG: HNH endonuclease, partial [Chitinophagaceae bacterium]|nr:HNH endonuclease [Chitinophagaceae bacterium]
NKVAQKNGYVYIYVSNESPVNVFFDNLQVVHTRGAILEETHYYPFGLVMEGISSKAVAFGNPKNKEKTFQGQQIDDDFGLNWVQFRWRNHDPQTGRFIEIDPLSEEYEYNSTYAFSENKVISHVELEGLEAVKIIGVGAVQVLGAAVEAVGAGTAFTAAAVAAPVVAIVTHPEVLLSGGASAAQMDFKVEKELRDNARKTPTPVQTAAKTGNAASSSGTAVNALLKSNKGVEKGVASSGKVGQSKIQERANRLSQNQRPGKDMTKAGKEAVKDVNKEKNNGETVCEGCGIKTTPSQQSKKGVTPSSTETQVDHIKRKSEGGSGTPDNGQILCRGCNSKKG